MVLKENIEFKNTKRAAIQKLTEAYNAITDLSGIVSNEDLKTFSDVLLDMRYTVRLIHENE